MRLTIDTDAQTLTVENQPSLPLYSPEAFQLLSEQWLLVGFDLKYTYSFTWLGLPIAQLPEDLIRLQEVVWLVKPNVIIETGISRGGSLIFYASLCQALGHGRVIGIDHRLWPQSRQAIEAHPLAQTISHRIQLIEGDSIAPDTVAEVLSSVQSHEQCLVILDSDHSTDHMLAELNAYSPLVKPGSYIIATDGIMKHAALVNVPRANPDWAKSNAEAAVAEFLQHHPEFISTQPPRLFDTSKTSHNLSQWPSGWLYRLE